MPQDKPDNADVIARLDQAIARGIADADAGRVHPAEEVFRALRERIQQRLRRRRNSAR